MKQHSPDTCIGCPANTHSRLKRLGFSMEKPRFVVALAGNPNTGKSTVFNALTGLRQHTGNWPGKTVTRAEGGFEYADNRYKIVDLPGTYSLLSTSTDEEVARNFVLFGQPDVTLVVADATRLERNLNLVLQILEITNSAVVCLNLMDEARRHRIEVDVRTLSKELGVPVVPVAARRREGISELLEAIHSVATGAFNCKPHRIKSGPAKLNKTVNALSKSIVEQFPGLSNARWVAWRLLEGDQQIINALQSGTLAGLSEENQSDTGNPQ